MKTADLFWKRVQEILDQRKDPFDDPEVQAYLLDHPDALEELVNLRHRLSLLERASARPSGKPVDRWQRLIRIGLPAACLAAVLIWICLEWPASLPPQETDGVAVSATPAEEGTSSVILDFTCTVTLTGPEAERSLVFTRDGWKSTWKPLVKQPGQEMNDLVCLAWERQGTF